MGIHFNSTKLSPKKPAKAVSPCEARKLEKMKNLSPMQVKAQQIIDNSNQLLQQNDSNYDISQ